MFATSEATTYTYMSGDKVLHKDYIVRNNICIRTINLTGNNSTWYYIELLYSEPNQIYITDYMVDSFGTIFAFSCSFVR